MFFPILFGVFVIGKITPVGLGATRNHLPDLGRETISEKPVVGDEYDGSLKPLQRFLENFHGGNIQVVKRFVENQNVHGSDQQLRQRKTAFLSPAADRHRLKHIVAPKEKTGEHVPQFRLHIRRGHGFQFVDHRVL